MSAFQTLSDSIYIIRNNTHNNIALKLYLNLDKEPVTDLLELITRLQDLNSLYDRTVNMQTCLNDLYNEAETYGIVKPRFMNTSHAQNAVSCSLNSHSPLTLPSHSHLPLTSVKPKLKIKHKPT